MKRLLLACLAVAVTAPSAAAAPGRCVALTDAKGDPDVLVADRAPGVDVVGARVVASTRDVTATFTLDGEPKPAPFEYFVYELTFSEKATVRTEYQLTVKMKSVLEPEFILYTRSETVGDGNATMTSWSPTPVGGTIDVARKTVTITAPATHFGRVSQGRRWSVDLVSSGYGIGATYTPEVDTVTPRLRSLTAGDGRCAR